MTRTIRPSSQVRRAGHASLIANIPAAISIGTITAQALRGRGAGVTGELFAVSDAVATKLTRACHGGRGIELLVGQVDALADKPRTRTRFTRLHARRIATDAFDAIAARALHIHPASLSVVALTRAHSVAGIHSRALSSVVHADRDIRAYALRAGQVARFAIGRARVVATYAVDTKTRDAFSAGSAIGAWSFQTISQSVTKRSALIGTHHIHGLRRIRRHTHHIAEILRALIGIRRRIHRIDGRNGIARAVTLQNHAIAIRLRDRRQILAGSLIRNGAYAHHAHEVAAVGLAIVAYAAIGRTHASGALAHAVARLHHRGTAFRGIRFGRIGGHSVGAHIRRAHISVDRRILVVIHHDEIPISVTCGLLAIPIFGGRQVHSGYTCLAAHIVHASPLLTRVRRDNLGALLSDIALHASAGCIADPHDARRNAQGPLRIQFLHRLPIHTRIFGARIGVVEHIRIVDKGHFLAGNADLLFAIAGDRHDSRRGQTIQW